MNKKEIYSFLKEKNIWHEITEHKAVYNMAELAEIEIPYPEADAKNLFVRDDKKRNYYLITVKGDKRVALKEFRKANQTRPLSFASEEDLMKLLNDEERKVTVFLDRDFFEESGLIGVHPNDNTATVWMKAEDLVRLIEEHGNRINVVPI